MTYARRSSDDRVLRLPSIAGTGGVAMKSVGGYERGANGSAKQTLGRDANLKRRQSPTRVVSPEPFPCDRKHDIAGRRRVYSVTVLGPPPVNLAHQVSLVHALALLQTNGAAHARSTGNPAPDVFSEKRARKLPPA